MEFAFFVKVSGALFAIMNPFMYLPVFLSFTTGYNVPEQRKLAIKVFIFSIAACAVILLGGKAVIGFFGITVDQFRIAGGAVLAGISWSMLNGSNVASHHGSAKEKDHMAEIEEMSFYPLTFPMMIGPGTIATIIIYADQAKGVVDMAIIGAIIGVILVVLLVLLWFSPFIGRVLSNTMRTAVTRVMGMILLAISVEMIVAGLKSVLPGLA